MFNPLAIGSAIGGKVASSKASKMRKSPTSGSPNKAAAQAAMRRGQAQVDFTNNVNRYTYGQMAAKR